MTRIANLHYFEFINAYHTVEASHDFCELLFVDRGEISVRAEHYNGKLLQNQLLIHRPNEVHALTCESDLAPGVIIIGFECDSAALSYFSKTPVTLLPEQKKLLEEVMQEGMRVYFPPFDMPNVYKMEKRSTFPFGADQMIQNRMEALLISLVRSVETMQASPHKGHQPHSNVEAIEQYLQENYAQPISLDMLCFLFSTNKTTLCNDFKATYKTTIVQYITACRIREAKALLRQNKLTVTEISEKLGFASIHYFCKVFKGVTGMTPKEYSLSIRSKLNL